jgi:cytochrome c oxidase subunit 3
MWLFLLTELLLFGTLFIVFANYYTKYRLEFHAAARQLDRVIGAGNTLVLLTSSLTMVLGVSSLAHDRPRQAIGWMLATVGFGLVFLVVKGFEWSHKLDLGIYPGGDVLLTRPQGEIVFFGAYFVLTGLHALHVVIGAVLIVVSAWLVHRGRVHAGRPTLVENAGLYWHLVDVIWVFLFPLFYLATR